MLLMGQLALMMKTVMPTGMKYVKKTLYSRTKFYILILLELKEVEKGKLQIVKVQIVTASLTILSPAI